MVVCFLAEEEGNKGKGQDREQLAGECDRGVWCEITKESKKYIMLGEKNNWLIPSCWALCHISFHFKYASLGQKDSVYGMQY